MINIHSASEMPNFIWFQIFEKFEYEFLAFLYSFKK